MKDMEHMKGNSIFDSKLWITGGGLRCFQSNGNVNLLIRHREALADEGVSKEPHN